MNENLNEHQNKVGLLKHDVIRAFKNGQKIKIKHGSTNSTRPQYDLDLKEIDTSSLNSVIEINTKSLCNS